MTFGTFCIYLLGGILAFSFAVCVIVFGMAFFCGKLEDLENNEEE